MQYSYIHILTQLSLMYTSIYICTHMYCSSIIVHILYYICSIYIYICVLQSYQHYTRLDSPFINICFSQPHVLTHPLVVVVGAPGGDSKVTKIFKRSGVGKLELDSASAGDVISMTGAAAAGIADTIGAVDLAAALSPGPIEPPTLR